MFTRQLMSFIQIILILFQCNVKTKDLNEKLKIKILRLLNFLPINYCTIKGNKNSAVKKSLLFRVQILEQKSLCTQIVLVMSSAQLKLRVTELMSITNCNFQ
jgi:hypothetical protein